MGAVFEKPGRRPRPPARIAQHRIITSFGPIFQYNKLIFWALKIPEGLLASRQSACTPLARGWKNWGDYPGYACESILAQATEVALSFTVLKS
jgi:hypothetical protein